MKKKMLILFTLILLLTFRKGVFNVASTAITNVGITSATGQILGLQAPFNTDTYISVGIALNPVTFGQSSTPFSICGSKTAPSTGTSTNSGTFFLTSFIYGGEQKTLYGYARSANGLYYPAGSATITTMPNTPTNVHLTTAAQTSLYFNWTNRDSRDIIWVKLNGSWQSIPTNSISKTYTGLSSDTSYTFQIYYEANSLTGSIVSVSARTDAPGLPSTPSNIALSSRVENGLVVSWYADTIADWFNIKARRASDNYTTTVYVQDGNVRSHTVTGLNDATLYYISVQAGSLDGSSSYSSEVAMTTSPDTPLVSLNNVTTNSIAIDFSLVGSWHSVEIKLYDMSWSLVNSQTKTTIEMVTFNGLSQGNQYHIQATSYFSEIASVSTGILNASILARPGNWSWTTIFTQGATIPTIYSGGVWKAAIIPATEWNNFTNRINEFRQYKGLSLYSFTLASADGNFMKLYFTDVKIAIDNMNPSIPTPSIPATVTASAFTSLKDSLNSIN